MKMGLLRPLILTLFWKRLPRDFHPKGPVMVTWLKASGAVRFRVAAYYADRIYQDKSYGPGFVCWWSGTPLTDTITHYRKVPNP